MGYIAIPSFTVVLAWVCFFFFFFDNEKGRRGQPAWQLSLGVNVPRDPIGHGGPGMDWQVDTFTFKTPEGVTNVRTWDLLPWDNNDYH